MNRRKINLHIENIVFTGMPEMQHQQIQAAMVHELTRLISQGALSNDLNRSQHISRVDGGGVEISRNASPTAIATRLAGEIYKGTVR